MAANTKKLLCSADLQVAIKCKSGADETYETKALGPLDDTGVFRIPLAAEILRDDGSMDRDCFAQLHSSLGTPCVGQAPPRIAPTTSQLDGGDSSTTYLAAATDDTVFAPVACACGKKKKHYMFGPPPPPRPTPTPTPNPPTTLTYGPPTPTPTPVRHDPACCDPAGEEAPQEIELGWRMRAGMQEQDSSKARRCWGVSDVRFVWVMMLLCCQ